MIKTNLWIAIFIGISLLSFSSNSLQNRFGLSFKETKSNPELKYTPEQNYLFETIKQRRTVRKFARTPVPKEHILYKLICFTPIGVPEKWPETPSKKKLEDLVIFESF